MTQTSNPHRVERRAHHSAPAAASAMNRPMWSRPVKRCRNIESSTNRPTGKVARLGSRQWLKLLKIR